MKPTTIAIDLAKNVMHAVAVDERGQELWRKHYRRAQLVPALARLAACEVAMECGSGAHYWGRELEALGHRVTLIPPQHVRPYRTGNKHDYNDARAIAEAASRAGTRRVPVKTAAQQEVLALHRIRESYVRQRTALINQWRGLVAEYGYTLPKGARTFLARAPGVWEALEGVVGPVLHRWLGEQLAWLRQLQERIRQVERDLKRFLQTDAQARLLERALPGLGVITATAFVARVGNGQQFARGRDCAAWLGLVPAQHSTGGKAQLLGISKRGDASLRTLLIHGARTVVRHARGKDDPFSQWVNRLRARRGENIAAVAVANKNARMAWALLRKQAAGALV